MPFNGAGVFQRIYSWVTDAANNINVDATRTDTDTDDIASGLSNCITKDGQQTITADIPFSTHKITGLGNGASPQDAVTFSQVFTAPTFAGLTATGVVNMAGATSVSVPTVAQTDNSTNAASTAYVTAKAFSTALPATAGNDGKSVTLTGGVVAWGVSPVTGGGTGLSIFTIGDIPYASGATALSKLAAGVSGAVLTSNGAGVAPSYQVPVPVPDYLLLSAGAF